jgi:3-hydroxyisobutyrate dehydrogenase
VTDLTVGFIGLGNQGEPIARRILAGGFPLQVWGRRSATTEPFRGTGATITASRRDLGQACDYVGVCVKGDDDALEVLLGSDGEPGVLDGMSAGATIAVHSTVAPATVYAIETRAIKKGVAVLDAPVSGGREGAYAGTMTVMVGGEQAAVHRATPVFETFARMVAHVGPLGAGQVVKLLNNNLCFANIVLAAEALDLSHRLGLDVDATTEVFKASSGASFGLGILGHEPMLTKMAGPTSNMDKDVRHFATLLREQGVEDRSLLAVSVHSQQLVRAYAATHFPTTGETER